MTTYTDNQLKQALAKMLPEQITCSIEGSFNRGTVQKLRWANLREVLDTELLHLCWLVEETLTEEQLVDVCRNIWIELHKTKKEYSATVALLHSTGQQRTIALAKVKGVEIV